MTCAVWMLPLLGAWGLTGFCIPWKIMNGLLSTLSDIEEKFTRDHDMTSDGTVATMVERIVERFQPHRVVLFGSRSRGTPNQWSDVDLLVVMGEAPNKKQLTVEMRRTLKDLPVGKDIVVTTPDEIERRGHVFGTVLHAALREGKVVYERC